MSTEDATAYRHTDARCSHAHEYLLPALESLLERFVAKPGLPRRLFDLGCGNGSVASHLQSLGYEVCGVDPSVEGIEQANTSYPHMNLRQGSAYDDLQSQFGTFPAVYSLEVVEHVYDPRSFARTLYSLVVDGGVAIVSTPYHAYLKNLAIVAAGKFDAHFDPLWDHGHIKFWTEPKLRELLEEAGFNSIEFQRVGRIPLFAKSMIACARKA